MSEKEFLTLIDHHQGIIHKVCRLYRDTPENREDLFQEIIFQLWKSFPAFEGRAKITSWMYRIALNTALASFRKKNRISLTRIFYQTGRWSSKATRKPTEKKN